MNSLQIFKNHYFYCGEWHVVGCNFIRYDEGVCNCDYKYNKKIITNAYKKIQENNRKRIMTKAYEDRLIEIKRRLKKDKRIEFWLAYLSGFIDAGELFKDYDDNKSKK